MKQLFYGLLLWFAPLLSSCQPITINGKIIDENGKPIPNATITIKHSNKKTISDQYGLFTIHDSRLTDTLIITAVGYETTEEPNNERGLITVILKHAFKSLNEVIISTGYQDLPKERAIGSFEFIDNSSLNRIVSADVLSRLENASAVYFDRRNGSANISIRGRSTIMANPQPLIVLDNFPYSGNISDINPNDIESITVLKDAAAASVWGAFSGNGVIVINTKKGKTNQPPKLELNANITFGKKPDLWYNPNFLDAADYINVEKTLFANGFYNSDINNTISYPVLSPVVDILSKRRNNLITPANSAAQLNSLSQLDVRKQFLNYLYRNSVNTQYAVNYSGASGKYNYYLSFGYDKNLPYLVRNSSERISVRSANSFSPSSKWDFSMTMVYTATNNILDNTGTTLANPSGKSFYPYEQLKDEQGKNLAIPKDYRLSYLDTAGNGKLLDWKYRPLDELAMADNRNNTDDALLNLGIAFKPTRNLSVQMKYQYEKLTGEASNLYRKETYMARNLVNLFTLVNGTIIKYQVPPGGILDRSYSTLNAQSFRAQVNYNKSWNTSHELIVLAGAEWRENHRTASSGRLYGYDDDILATGAVNYADFLNTYNNVGGTRNIPNPVYLSDALNRFVSVFTNGSYSYSRKYIFSISARKDASNLFGVSANQKWVPLWSAGIAWQLDREKFYRISWLPYLKLRITYGYNGNMDNTLSALTTLLYFTYPSAVNNQTYANVNNPPNPGLQWEKDRIINFGADFASKTNRISGSIEYYLKKGTDLIGYTALDPTTGFVDQTGTSFTFKGNVANMKGKGFELDLVTRNLVGKIKWDSHIQFNYAADEITKYNYRNTTAASYVGDGLFITAIPGKPVFSIFSYKWAGLDPLTGDPRGYDANKQVSKDYTSLLNTKLDDLEYNGPALPVVYGFFTNTISYKNISLSANLSYKLGYYFRKTSVNYGALYSQWRGHSDFLKRWQNPGDELKTNVPSMVYPNNSNRDVFYSGSSVLVEKGDHIRLQDISVSYSLTRSQVKKLFAKELQLYLYANNIGIIWKANKSGLDPDYYGGGFPLPRTIAFGIKTNF